MKFAQHLRMFARVSKCGKHHSHYFLLKSLIAGMKNGAYCQPERTGLDLFIQSAASLFEFVHSQLFRFKAFLD
jgi:hypothetical protein